MPFNYSFLSGDNGQGTDALRQWQAWGAQQQQATQPSINQVPFTQQQGLPQATILGPLNNVPVESLTNQNIPSIVDAGMYGEADPLAASGKYANDWTAKFGGRAGVSQLMASLGKAFSAKDPSSWQYQLNTQLQSSASAQMQQRGMLIAALQQKLGASGKGRKVSIGGSPPEGLTEAGRKYSIGNMKPDFSFLNVPTSSSLTGGTWYDYLK